MSTRMIKLGQFNFPITEEGSGDPVLLLHGFPDSARLWRHQIPALVAAGFRVIAPDQRGFGESDKPQEVEAYALREVIGDAIALLDALGLDRVKLVSHDWGAAVGWGLAAFHPERIVKHVALSVGHLSALWNAGLAQRRLAWYMLLFMRRGLAEDILTRDNWLWFRDLFQHHSEMETWIRDLSRPGALTAGLNWYRANVDVETWKPEGWVLPRTPVPTLGVWSSGDAYLTEVQMATSGQYVDGPWQYLRVEGASHWLTLDRPAHLAQVLVDYLRQRHGTIFLVGPDEESEQWVSSVAKAAEAPYVTLRKTRRGDNDVSINFPDIMKFDGLAPVLIDDIISSGHTMQVAVTQLVALGFVQPVCLAAHGILAADAMQRLKAAGAVIVTTNTIPGPTAALEVNPILV